MLDIPLGSANSISRDGTVITGTVGLLSTYSLYWMDGSPPTIRNIEFLKDGTKNYVAAVSGNGIIAVGHGNTTGGVERAFSWNKNSSPATTNLGVIDGYDRSAAHGVNNDGTVIVGNTHRSQGNMRAIRWKEETDYPNQRRAEILHGPREASGWIANDTNGDGTVIVGQCFVRGTTYSHAIYWPEGTITDVQTLECLGVHSSASAYAVSDDGTVIVGESTEPYNPNIMHAVCWKRNPSTGQFNISNLGVRPDPPQDTWSAIAHGVNHNGTVIVGVCLSHNDHQREAFIWRADTTPQVQKLEDATQGYKASVAFDVTTKPDGTNVSVGMSSFREASGGTIAVRWNNLSIVDLHFPS